ncbi:MAG: hypothetical protein QOD30_2060, partial [Actinomycetota bacterium]|nr:hypothetical protein [Actinomycetota bacterium]
AGAAGSALGLNTGGISTHEWRLNGIIAAAVGAVVLFGAFWFGGYTAGRMSRRAGARHGLLVFLLSVVLIGVIALIAWAVRGSVHVDVVANLRDNGVPTNRSTWADIGLGAGIAGGLAMLLGSLFGGIRGDRWHGRLATAAVEARDAAATTRDERTDETVVDDTTVDRRATADRTDAIDLREQPPSIEEEREQTRATMG